MYAIWHKPFIEVISQELLSNLTYLGIPLSEYAENYHQQISLAFVFSMFFRLIHFDVMEVLRALNVIGNFLIIYALYKIIMQLSKKYKINKILFFILILTFFIFTYTFNIYIWRYSKYSFMLTSGLFNDEILQKVKTLNIQYLLHSLQ